MPKIVSLILIGHFILLFGSVLASLDAYGGIKGNVPYELDSYRHRDAFLEFKLIFNRWYLGEEETPLLVRGFMILNSPSAFVAWGTFRALERLSMTFQKPFPLGLSSGSYTYGLTFLISPFQSLGIGYLANWYLRRRLT